MEAARTPWPVLGVLLIRDGLVTAEQLEEVLEERHDSRENRISSRRLGEALVERGYVTSAQVATLVAEQHGLPFIDLTEPDAMVPLAVRLPEEIARRLSALPIRVFPDGSLLVVVADPTKPGIFDEIRSAVGVPIRLAVAAPDLIEVAIDEACADQRFRSAEVVDVTETLENRDAEGPSPETGLYLATVPEGAEPPVTDGQYERARRVLGSLLLRDGLVTELELETALAQQRLSSTRRLGEILIQRGAVTETQVARALAEQHELPFVNLAEHELDFAAAARLPADFAREHRVLPISYLPGGGSLLVVTADPASAVQSDELRDALGCPFQLAVAAAEEIDAAFSRVERVGLVVAAVPDPEQEQESAPKQDSQAEPAHELQLDPPPELPALPELPVPIETESEPEGEPEAEGRVQVDSAPAEAEIESEIDPETEVVVQADLDDEARVEAETEIGSETEVEAETTDEWLAEVQAEADVAVFVEAVPEREPRADLDDETVTAPESDIGPESKSELVAHADVDDEAGAETDTEIEPETEVEAETADELPAEVEADDDEGTWQLPELEAELQPDATVMLEIECALAFGATAVHVVARPGAIVVHARFDGALTEVSSIPVAEPALTAAVAALARPVRTAFAVEGHTVELRPTVLSTAQGTRLTFRLVENGGPPESLDELLGSPVAAEDLRTALGRRNGLVVLCSPTHSARHALLRSALPELVGPGRTVLSIEDPVEHLVHGVEQVDVDPRAGVTFATGLHSILRSDADAAAVGELIDPETIRLATRGALGSCLVVTTLAAGSAAEAACRLRELGAESGSLADALACIAAGRRLRAICVECRTSSYATLDELTVLGRPPEEGGRRLLARSNGCAACDGTGYSGWLRVSETLPLADGVRHAVATGAPREEIERVAAEAGMRTVADAAVEFCLEGMTTTSEVARILGVAG